MRHTDPSATPTAPNRLVIDDWLIETNEGSYTTALIAAQAVHEQFLADPEAAQRALTVGQAVLSKADIDESRLEQMGNDQRLQAAVKSIAHLLKITDHGRFLMFDADTEAALNQDNRHAQLVEVARNHDHRHNIDPVVSRRAVALNGLRVAQRLYPQAEPNRGTRSSRKNVSTLRKSEVA